MQVLFSIFLLKVFLGVSGNAPFYQNDIMQAVFHCV